MGEADVPAKQPEAGQEPRFPPPDGDPGRPRDPASPTPARQAPARRLRPAGAGTWRIRDRATFAALAREGRRVRQGPVTVTYLPSASARPRVAYAVARRVGGAVVRNRLRRRLRAVVAEHSGELHAGAYLLGAAPEAAALPFDELRTNVAEALRAVGGGGR